MTRELADKNHWKHYYSDMTAGNLVSELLELRSRFAEAPSPALKLRMDVANKCLVKAIRKSKKAGVSIPALRFANPLQWLVPMIIAFFTVSEITKF